MEIFLIYVFKTISLQVILFSIFWLIGRNKTSFQFNRFFLLSTLILPFFLPMLSIPVDFFRQEINTNDLWLSFYFIDQSLPNVVITESNMIIKSKFWWTTLIIVIYLLVTIPSIFTLVSNYIKIIRLHKSCTKKESTPKGFTLYFIQSKILSFSFLDRIFISNSISIKPLEKKNIITHEEYHLTQHHSIDILLVELIRIICWFNPIIRLIQECLKETHEFLADRHTVNQHGKNYYTSMLRSFSWQEINMKLGNGYSSASINKRLNMMENPDKKSPFLQIFLPSIIALFTVFLFACEDNLDSFENNNQTFQYELSEAELKKDIEKRVDILKKQNAPQDMIDIYIREQNKYPEYLFRPHVLTFANVDPQELFTTEKIKALFVSGILETEVIYIRKVESIDNNRNKTNHFSSDEMRTVKISKNRFALIEKINRTKYMEYTFKMKGESGIQDDYDKKAQFKGGHAKLTQYLKENLNYPEVAKKFEIEDKVILHFVVTKQGGLIYLNIDQEPSTSNEEVSIELQKAAFHAIRSTSGMWRPAEKNGKYVASRLTLPIEFKL